MASKALADEFKDMLRVGEAASFLGVSRETLRNWDKSGRLKPARHPITGYRYYQLAKLEEFLNQAVGVSETT